jgi:hypothetical protein
MDSVAATGTRVYDLIRLVDRYGRPEGAPPTTLDPIVERSGYAHRTDLWGGEMRYRHQGIWYEVRSAGPDGMLYTTDDIVGLGRLGSTDPCRLHNGVRTVVENRDPACADPPAF